MTFSSLALVLTSVLISAFAQILLKIGTTAASAKQDVSGEVGVFAGYAAMLSSPAVLAGLAAYGIGAIVWLSVLSRLDVSQAYPFVALGFVLTTLMAFVVLGEPMYWTRISGTALILGGVVLVGWK